MFQKRSLMTEDFCQPGTSKTNEYTGGDRKGKKRISLVERNLRMLICQFLADLDGAFPGLALAQVIKDEKV